MMSSLHQQHCHNTAMSGNDFDANGAELLPPPPSPFMAYSPHSILSTPAQDAQTPSSTGTTFKKLQVKCP